jgi:hypothetical protein
LKSRSANTNPICPTSDASKKPKHRGRKASGALSRSLYRPRVPAISVSLHDDHSIVSGILMEEKLGKVYVPCTSSFLTPLEGVRVMHDSSICVGEGMVRTISSKQVDWNKTLIVVDERSFGAKDQEGLRRGARPS